MNTISVIELRKYSEQKLYEKGLKSKDLDELLKYSYVNYKNDYYAFSFVGIIIVDDIVIECYPKYISNEDFENQDFKELINVIRRYNRLKEEINNDFSESKHDHKDLLLLMLFFLDDYYENGVYTNTKTILELNGKGEINWEKTINNYHPIIQNNKPYYMELETRYNQDDIYNYFRILHEFVITDCSKKLEELELLELFDVMPVELSEKTIEDFEDVDIILNKLENEFNMEFNSHKQKILKSMYAYLSKKYNSSDDNTLMVYGTSYYSQIWESVCQLVLDDQLHVKLKNLPLTKGLNGEFISKKEQELISLIDKPKWIIKNKNSDSVDSEDEKEKSTLIPDLVTFYNNYFIIFDAKYYDLHYKNNILSGQPGVGDITKQYFYEEAFKKFVNAHNNSLNGFKNGFLLPTEGEETEIMGYVKFDFIENLEVIRIIKLPASEMYKRYLNNNPINDLSELQLNEII